MDMEFMNVMKKKIAVALLSTIYVAPLREFLERAYVAPSFTLYLVGRTQTGKTTAATLGLSHYGIFKRDVNGDPGDIEITIANTPRDAADSINTLADRVGIGELYSQGATNLFAIPFADNADENHPAKFRVYIPAGMVRINKMLLSWQIQSFRAYSTGAAAGGSTTRTSSGGGGGAPTTSVSDTVTYTSEYGGDTTITQPATEWSTPGVAELGTVGQPYNSDTGELMTNTEASRDTLSTGAGTAHSHDMRHYHGTVEHSHTVNSHNHGMNHYHMVNSHSHTVNSHHHGMDHYHTVDSHSHQVNSHDHFLNIVAWADVNNKVEISDHTEDASPYTDARSPATTGAKQSGADRNYTGDASPATDAQSPSTTGAKQSGSDRNNTGDASPDTNGKSPNTTGPKNNDDGTVLTNTGTESSHTHPLTVHGHGMDHYHYSSTLKLPAFDIELPAHGHNVSIPGHSHTVELPTHTHDVTLPDHTHDIVYGIYDGGRASNVTIRVDGTDVPAGEISSSEIDVSGYLSKDDNGKIRRGAWHEIQIVPDGLTRIEANLTAQVFVQSVGGGDY